LNLSVETKAGAEGSKEFVKCGCGMMSEVGSIEKERFGITVKRGAQKMLPVMLHVDIVL
jgi:hypothetical protein